MNVDVRNKRFNQFIIGVVCFADFVPLPGLFGVHDKINTIVITPLAVDNTAEGVFSLLF